MLSDPVLTVLCRDPKTTHRLNCNAFQQHGLTTEFGWQYAVFYTSDTPEAGAPRFVSIARRHLPSVREDADRGGARSGAEGEWQRIVLRDYVQSTEDGHNTISMGISKGDGRIHLVWDLHCDHIRYRRSNAGVAWSNDQHWSEQSFGDIQSGLYGAEDDCKGKEITYPRFLSMSQGDMFFECRVGRAGSGDAALCRYERSEKDGWQWKWLGVYLRGKDCSPYTNGLDFGEKKGRLWVTWTNRRFTEKQRECDVSQKAQQAGPNGPENNEDLGCLYSEDGGNSWRSTESLVLAGAGTDDTGVDSRDDRAIVRRIPRNSGIMNQEAQCVDDNGNVHVLMRDNSTGVNQWKHHWRSNESVQWSTYEISGLQATDTGARGKVTYDSRKGDIYFVIPGNTDPSLTVLRRKYLPAGEGRGEIHSFHGYGSSEILWQQYGFDGEPLIDVQRLHSADGRLSVMTRATQGMGQGGANVVVLDWDLTSSQPRGV